MKNKIFLFASFLFLTLSSCEDVLDRPPLDRESDDVYWTSELKLRLYANEYYERYFLGYGKGGNTTGAALVGYLLNDDIVSNGSQSNLELQIPTSRGNNAPTSSATGVTNIPWLNQYTGTDWTFSWLRKSNIMINRIETRMDGILSAEAKNHWLGIARFFRAMEYANLVTVFGDVPYYNKEVGTSDIDELYKDRTNRDEVMDAVYEDLLYAMENVRTNDGDQTVNKYVVAAYTSRLAMVEGSWLKYHYNKNERAKKFFELALKGGDMVRLNNRYDIDTPFRTLFGSKNLSSSKECILYRHYDAAMSITHSVASNCNLASRSQNPNAAFLKAFICNDGMVWQNSSLNDADQFDLASLALTRDSRLEASLWEKPTEQAKGSLLYACKFIDREGPTYNAEGKPVPTQYISPNSDNDYPVMRLAEVLLNWIEAKAEIASIGGDPILQGDLDASVNRIRNRPLDEYAIKKGVLKTKPMMLNDMPNDPSRDNSVAPLLWEIRRERRMEMAFEHSRLADLRRWKKLEYMDTDQNPDILKGAWVNFQKELPAELKAGLAVTTLNGTKIVYNGSNAAQMVGFYSPEANKKRMPFLGLAGINPYLAPIGVNQQVDYKSKGYNLSQTQGWGK